MEILHQFSSKLLELLIALAVPFIVYALGRAATALLIWARAGAAEVDNVIIGKALEAGIIWAQVQLADRTGAERLAWVVQYLNGKGIKVDKPEVEAYFQQLNKYGDLPVKPAASLPPQEAAR